MATRTSFRPRPLDLSKPLPIVRDVRELDNAEGLVSREVTHNHETLDKENEEAIMVQSAKAKGGKEIPIPTVTFVPTYKREYLPTYREAKTYHRGRGALGYLDERFVEYDLDSEDERWLEGFNRGQDRLPPRRLEYLLWRLEVANAEATDRALSGAGATHAEKQSPAAVAATEHMAREEAYAALAAGQPLRAPVRDAVLAYWKRKRAARGRPLLRRLQAPTSSSDTNPFNVFRPREKINRPQTRRRRENNEDSVDKMQAIRRNLKKAWELLEYVTRREERKRNLVYVETDLQQLQIRQRHDPRQAQEAIEAQYAAAVRAKSVERPLVLASAEPDKGREGDAREGAAVGGDADASRLRKRRKDPRRPTQDLASLPPVPPPLPPDMLFAMAPDLARLSLAAGAGPLSGTEIPNPGVRARVGRGGRLVLDRCHAMDCRRFDELDTPADKGVTPLWELPNPYATQPSPVEDEAPRNGPPHAANGGPHASAHPPVQCLPNGSVAGPAGAAYAANGTAPPAARGAAEVGRSSGGARDSGGGGAAGAAGRDAGAQRGGSREGTPASTPGLRPVKAERCAPGGGPSPMDVD
ncbi:hypothetical protein WJX81_005242 [Elliptochloris bilobata]|uniref:Enhancer of polycomb-like protein n=1 Tax=Elliptochloris bilobata TaxID=381761 RepID=A0AAW1SCG6_9CHLO